MFQDSFLYKEDISTVLKLPCNWQLLKGKKILLSGGTGLIGTYIKDMFVLLNTKYDLNLQLYILARNISEYVSNDVVKYIKHDVSLALDIDVIFDFIIHAASNTHPVLYAKEPVNTITTNILGTLNLLKLSINNPNCRFLLLSSVEIYGDDTNHLTNGFAESDYGYLDCNTSRAGYCESKRLCESLCQSFKSQYGIDVVINRLCRSYGPTLRKDDSKALSQFLRNGLNKENIILKSKGEQYYSYIYASDAACSVIFLLLNGKSGEAYNVADKKSNIHLKDLANIIAEACNTDVVFDLPSETELKGFSKAQTAILDSTKINNVGFKACYSIEDGIKRTLDILRGCNA